VPFGIAGGELGGEPRAAHSSASMSIAVTIFPAGLDNELLIRNR
jgi:hypothetical protein